VDVCFLSDVTLCVPFEADRQAFVGVVVEDGDEFLLEPWLVDKQQ
jgi:hypothetical protein